MDTLKSANCSKSISFLSICVISFLLEGVCFAEASTINKKLVGPVDKRPGITAEEPPSSIINLERALADCKEPCLRPQLKYQLGLEYFKAHMIDMAKAQFLQVAKDPNYPEIIQIYSLNMVGQIARLNGEADNALEAFERLANLAEQASNCSINPALTELACLGLTAKAEIHESKLDFDLGIAEYNRLMHLLSRDENIYLLNHYKPFAADRISQLYLKRGDFKKYLDSSQTIITDCPEYYRTPIIKFERECVSLLKTIDANYAFPSGSFDSPAQAIAYLKNSKDKAIALPIINKLCEICEEYRNTYGGTLLQYHYACLIDTFGEKDKAAKIFKQVFSTEVLDKDEFRKKASIETVQNYARIQYALLLKEKGDYKEALQVLTSFRMESDKSHLAEFVKSMRQCIQTYQKEISKNETK